MTLDQAIKKIEDAIKAARHRQEHAMLDETKNVKELLFAIEYALNPPTKTERKA